MNSGKKILISRRASSSKTSETASAAEHGLRKRLTVLLLIQGRSNNFFPGPSGFLLFFIGKFCDANRFLNFFYWHEALRAEKRKPLVATVGNLTFMPSAFDRRFWLEHIFNCSMSHMIGWIKYLWVWEWSVYVHLYGYEWRTSALSTDCLTREG